MLVNAEQPAPAPVPPPVPLAAMAGGLTMPPPPLLPALALGEGTTPPTRLNPHWVRYSGGMVVGMVVVHNPTGGMMVEVAAEVPPTRGLATREGHTRVMGTAVTMAAGCCSSRWLLYDLVL